MSAQFVIGDLRNVANGGQQIFKVCAPGHYSDQVSIIVYVYYARFMQLMLLLIAGFAKFVRDPDVCRKPADQPGLEIALREQRRGIFRLCDSEVRCVI